MLNATLQSKVDDLERRLAVLEQFIQPLPGGGLSISAPSGSLNINNPGGGIAIWGAMGVSVSGDRGVGLQCNTGNLNVDCNYITFRSQAGKITMNVAPTIQA
jgi:hypothetical protein